MRRHRLIIGLLLVILVSAGRLTSAEHVISELGCANCHATLPYKSTLGERTPDLSSAGLRYNPAWLFEYLQNPTKIRQHLGRARMPSFYLNEKEALALVEFLATQKQVAGDWPELPQDIQRLSPQPPRTVSAGDFNATLAKGMACLGCHTLDGKGGVTGVELGQIAFRLRRDWVWHYLVAPEMYGVPHTTMPAQFYVRTNRQFEAIVPEAAGKMDVVVNYLFSLNGDRKVALEERFNRAKQSATNITAELGRAIFVGLNCAACHRSVNVAPRVTNAAPDLTQESSRVKASWLEAYLRKPFSIRPFGYHPGDGSRMPDFRLNNDEVSDVLAALGKSPQTPSLQSRALTAFARQKAKLLLTDKLSCLGCHRLGEVGGRIAPDLTAVGNRLQPDYLLSVVQDPRKANPHSIMPRVPLTPDLLHLITGCLLSQQQSPASDSYLSLVDHPTIETSSSFSEGPERNYAQNCAPCHGRTGGGDGFNARYLSRGPTIHSDAEYMSRRPDDTLFDGIHSGAGILNRSPYMPPWGETFERKEIAGLVKYLRSLCRCEGPNWSRDGTRQP